MPLTKFVVISYDNKIKQIYFIEDGYVCWVEPPRLYETIPSCMTVKEFELVYITKGGHIEAFEVYEAETIEEAIMQFQLLH